MSADKKPQLSVADKMRRKAKAISAAFDAINELPYLVRIEVLEEMLEALKDSPPPPN